MAGTPFNADELIAQLEGSAIKTSQGSFVKVDDIRKLMETRAAAEAVSEALPQPRTLREARAGAREYLKEQGVSESGPYEPGRSVPANLPQSPSRA